MTCFVEFKVCSLSIDDVKIKVLRNLSFWLNFPLKSWISKNGISGCTYYLLGFYCFYLAMPHGLTLVQNSRKWAFLNSFWCFSHLCNHSLIFGRLSLRSTLMRGPFRRLMFTINNLSDISSFCCSSSITHIIQINYTYIYIF